MVPGLGLYCTDPAQPLTTAGDGLDDLYDLDHDLSEVSKPLFGTADGSTPGRKQLDTELLLFLFSSPTLTKCYTHVLLLVTF